LKKLYFVVFSPPLLLPGFEVATESFVTFITVFISIATSLKVQNAPEMKV